MWLSVNSSAAHARIYRHATIYIYNIIPTPIISMAGLYIYIYNSAVYQPTGIYLPTYRRCYFLRRTTRLFQVFDSNFWFFIYCSIEKTNCQKCCSCIGRGGTTGGGPEATCWHMVRFSAAMKMWSQWKCVDVNVCGDRLWHEKKKSIWQSVQASSYMIID